MARKRLSLIHLILYFTSCLEAAFPSNASPPEIMYGDSCIPGNIYRMECNSCHCINDSRLVCTKMACLRKSNLRGSNTDVCTPGKFYNEGCRRCFCSDAGQLICGPRDCKTVNKLPKTHEAIHSHSKYAPEDQYKLPTLKHQGSQCEPGTSYRVDCNTCLCLASGNLLCGQLLCPSHGDAYKAKAKKISGKPCDGGWYQTQECVQCQCTDGISVCQAKPNCVPIRKHRPIEHAVQCSPGMVYKKVCNKCYCRENRSLQCTMKRCLNKSQASNLRRIRKQFVDYTQLRQTDAGRILT